MATASSVSPAYSAVCIMYSSLQNRTLACLSFTYFSPGASLCVHQVMLGKVPKGEVDIQAKAESESECIWSVAISAEPELTARKGLEKPPSRRNSAELWLLHKRSERMCVCVHGYELVIQGSAPCTTLGGLAPPMLLRVWLRFSVE